MYIIDLEGRPVKVTDIQATLSIVEEYISYDINDDIPSVQRFNERRKEYWIDFHTKLLKQINDLKLKTKNNGNDTI